MSVLLYIETRQMGDKESNDFYNILVAALVNLIKLPNW